jgi:SAM-dependent methyltransferase
MPSAPLPLNGVRVFFYLKIFLICYTTSMNPYNSKHSAKEYLEFLNSENGKLQQEFLWSAIRNHLPVDTDAHILDAACGSGWLAEKMHATFPSVSGFDSSEMLVNTAKAQYANIAFQVADIHQPLPYPEETFDTVVLNMAATDLAKPIDAYKNIAHALKPNGSLIVTLPNPYYTYPVGIWKRSVHDFLLGRKPRLRLRSLPYNPKELLPSWDPKNPTSHFYSLPDHMSSVMEAGLIFNILEEIRSQEDSPTFNLQYQLFRFPLFLLLEYKKPSQ